MPLLRLCQHYTAFQIHHARLTHTEQVLALSCSARSYERRSSTGSSAYPSPLADTHPCRRSGRWDVLILQDMYLGNPDSGCPESGLDRNVLVHPLRTLLSSVLRFLLVVEVHAFGLGEFVDFAADEARPGALWRSRERRVGLAVWSVKILLGVMMGLCRRGNKDGGGYAGVGRKVVGRDVGRAWKG